MKSVVLKDGKALASFLGRTPASAYVAALDQKIEPLLASAAYSWIIEAYRDARARWLRGLSALNLSPQNDGNDIIRLFTALRAISERTHIGMDMRTFSARILGDSKAMERLQASFARLWTSQHDQDALEPTDLLATLGLEKTPQPVLLRGRLATGNIDLSAMQPYMGLPGDLLSKVRITSVPDYVLTVENMTSFQRHCREIGDDGLILYSSGFPNPSAQSLLRRLDAEIPLAVPFFHWGDTDARGIEILAFIASLCPSRKVRPHLMDRDPWQPERPVTSKEANALARIANSETAGSTLAQRLIDKGIPLDFEQENFDPKPLPLRLPK